MTSLLPTFAACMIAGLSLFSWSPHFAKADLLISAVGVSGVGSFNNNPSLIIDGLLPPRGTNFSSPGNVSWSGVAPQFTLDLGAIYTVSNLIAVLDNNDDYLVQYSTDNQSFANLFAFLAGDGPVTEGQGGMEILTTNAAYPSSVSYPGDLTTPVYVGRRFSPVSARYLRIFATRGDNFYAIGELQAFQAAVPEPSSLVLLGTGLAALIAPARRRWLSRRN